VGLLLALVPNVLGLGTAKWLHNAGAVASWIPVALLVGLAWMAWQRFGSATAFTSTTMLPAAGLREAVLCSSIAFAYGGIESSSLLAGEIVDPRRAIPRAIVVAGALITGIYLAGTAAVLIALPASEVSGMAGLVQAIDRAGARLELPGLAPLAAALIAVGGVGMAGAWLASTARLPFVAGVDHYLPASFARLHPRWGTPHVALGVQSLGAAAFAVLGSAGVGAAAAYDALVSMGVIAYFIPFLLLFAALVRLQREPAGPGVIRVPGGRPVAIALGTLGFATTAAAMALAVMPSPGTERPGLAVAKVVGASAVLLGLGVWLYRAGVRRRVSGTR
jgi:amino acid transporter